MLFNCRLVEYTDNVEMIANLLSVSQHVFQIQSVITYSGSPLSQAHNTAHMILVLKDGNPLSDKTYIHKLQLYWTLSDESITGPTQANADTAVAKSVRLPCHLGLPFLARGTALSSNMWKKVPHRMVFSDQYANISRSFFHQDFLAVQPK